MPAANSRPVSPADSAACDTAGKLIEDAGLKGFSVGGAQVSKKHAGFVINTGSATAADIWNLCNEIQNRVQNEFGVTLEMEIQKLGSFEQQKTKG